MAKVAIVILNWNGQKMLAKYLSGVVEYSRQDAEVWVADNSSTDGSMHLLETQYPQVKTIVLEQNFGFAEGYNQALKQIEAEYYVLLNSDVEVTHHWLTPLIEFMDSHPQVAACQPKLLAEYDKDSFEYAGLVSGKSKCDFLRSLDAFILPTYFEGLPMSLLETMSYGVTPVVTPVGSIPQVVKDGVNGMFITDHDSDSIVSAIKRLDEDRSILRKLGVAARETIFNQFSPEKYVEKLNSIYHLAN